MKYAMKYMNINIGLDSNILIPKKVICGDVEGDRFIASNDVFSYINSQDFDSKYIVGPAYSMDELRKRYNASSDYSDKDVLGIFELEEKENFMVSCGGKTLVITPCMLNQDNDKLDLFQVIDGELSVFLNENRIKEILKVSEDRPLKDILYGYKDALVKFKSLNTKFIELKNLAVVNSDSSIGNDNTFVNSDFTVSGLYSYLKEHIVGHDEELKSIATVLVMNYYSNPYYGTDSILIPGPTGTGKTATFNVASQYFDIPFKNINTINLVPEGIVGDTIEDEFLSLIDECKGDLKRAEKAIIVFDEFDKLGVDNLDTKASLVNIFLKVLEGGKFSIVRQGKPTVIYNTLMASKVALGTFSEAFKKDTNLIGFNSNYSSDEVFDKDLLVKKGYFSSELLTRFSHFIPYGNLSDDDRLKIILESKLSAFLLKKERLESQFGVSVIGDYDFAKGVIDSLKDSEKSVRDINNIISSVFLPIEYDILDSPGKYKSLVLNRDSVSCKSYDLY